MDLDRVVALVVDNSEFSSKIAASILRSFGVGRILTAKDGIEAVDIMRKVATDPVNFGVQCIDLVFSEMLMTPIDGHQLLKWVRRHKDSPDRYMPFVMCSAMADPEAVNRARDLGVTEFLAKPFSIGAFSEKMIQLVNRPRPYVYNYDYFGPDRRRQDVGAPNGTRERRVMKKEETETVFSGKTPEKLNRKPKVWFFKLPNRIKDKSGGLGAGTEVNITIDPALMQIAEQQLGNMEGDYMDWVKDRLEQMIALYEEIDLTDMSKTVKKIRKINDITHDVRGQGTTLGYPLITRFSQSLFEFTRSTTGIDERLVELIKAHMDVIGAVMRDKVKGDGGEIGQSLIMSIDKAKERFHIEKAI